MFHELDSLAIGTQKWVESLTMNGYYVTSLEEAGVSWNPVSIPKVVDGQVDDFFCIDLKIVWRGIFYEYHYIEFSFFQLVEFAKGFDVMVFSQVRNQIFATPIPGGSRVGGTNGDFHGAGWNWEREWECLL